MSRDWAERQRKTNRLVRRVANYVLGNSPAATEQLYGLCKLTWITKSFDDDDASYIRSTKIPGLGFALQRDYKNWTLDKVARDVAAVLKSDDVSPLVRGHTGFTNFYNPYRNSCRQWLDEHRVVVIDLFARALALKTDSDGRSIVETIMTLSGVPKANVLGDLLPPENLLTPVLFSLDSRLRFPLINGNKGVQALLAALGVSNSTLDEQYERMISLYGQGGINDAADLDQIGADLPQFIEIRKKRPTKKLLEQRATAGKVLPLKDESDLEVLQQARSATQRRLHNVLTNALRECLAKYTLLEGADPNALFDVLVKNYDGEGNDLLVEAKSSVDPPAVRLAVGQLFDYWFRVKGPTVAPHLAILTPMEPDTLTQNMLKWMNVGVLWFDGDTLCTATTRLATLCAS